MLKLLRVLIIRLFGSEEINLLMRLLGSTARRKSGSPDEVEPAIDSLERYFLSDKFYMLQTSTRDFVSCGGGVEVSYDIHGPEVRFNLSLRWPDLKFGLIDCAPDDYGLTYPEARRIYKSILVGHQLAKERSRLALTEKW